MNHIFKNNYFLFVALLFYVAMVFLRDAIQFSEYILIHKTIPYYRIDLENTSIISYSRDFAILLWNVTWTFFLFSKNKLVLYILYFFAFVITLGMMLINSNFQIFLLLSDLRILSGTYSVIGILLISQYFLEVEKKFELSKIIKFFLFLSFIDAIITLIEFEMVHRRFDFRVMGLFSNAALNSYVLLLSVVLVYLLKYYKHIKNSVFYFLTILFSFAILTTGTRTSIVGVLLLVAIFTFIKLFQTKVQSLKLFYIVLAFLIFVAILPKIINTANVIAGRGDMLNQGNTGRISKMIDIIDVLSSDGIISLLLGKGSGIGSNIASSTLNLPKVYTSVDGTLQFLFVHSGILGLLFFLFIIFKSYVYIHNIKMFIIVIVPMLIVSMSVNIFEIYPLLLVFGLNLAFIKQQDYYLKRHIQ